MAYGIVGKVATPSGFIWQFSGPPPIGGSTNPNLLVLLNLLNQRGWRVVAMGDLGGGQGDEILMEG